ncbi:hypothetical protein FHS77_001195 [Paenochrobactrum gallinarii]|uniref:Uncharacterized protein n=1 Tax=Paenochrobactrum gallinarii TaxID=643673 RepID=A0A841M2W5_9HYPH|nr:hypothetical protein [Paenochrobactrum gallinarii]
MGVFHTAGVYLQALGGDKLWNECIGRMDFNEDKLFNDIKKFIKGRQDLITLNPAAVIVLYINNTCGFLPDGIPVNR